MIDRAIIIPTRRSTILKLGFTLIAAMMALSGFAQNVSQQENTISLPEVRQLRAEAEGDSALEEGLRTQILALLDGAIKSLETAVDYRAAADGFAVRTDIDRELARLRTELEERERIPRLPLPANPTVPQAEDALARERARLAANRAALRDQERVVEDRAKLRGDISQRLGELDLELELVNDELRRLAETASRTELNEVARVHAMARREAASSENNMLRARLALLGDRSSLIPLETDLAQRRVSFSLEMVQLLEDATHELRVGQAQEMLARILEQSRTLADGLPAIASIAAETEELAKTLWDRDGVLDRGERTIKALATTRNHQAQLNRIADLTSRKFKAYGHRGSVTRWWPDVPADFPKPGVIAKIIQNLEEEIPEIQGGLIFYEQKRSQALQLARETMLQLEDDPDHPLDPDLALAVRDLFMVRQDVLDELIQRLGQYSNALVAYRNASASFLKRIEDVERFLYSHILWSRSVPKPVIPRLRDVGQALKWLISTEHLRSASFVGFPFLGNGILVALILILILLLRKPMRRRMNKIADCVSDPEQDGLRYSFGVLLYTILLAAPLPLALYAASGLARLVGDTTYWFAAAEAFYTLALVAALLELVRQLFGPSGLAEAHFAWPTQATRPLHRGLLWTEAIGLPLLFISLHLGFAGMRLDSPGTLQLYNNSLGRVAFIATMLVFGMSILGMLRWERKTNPSKRETQLPWPRPFSVYAFPTVFLGAYPLIVLGTVVPAALAALGFYLTGMLLAYQMLCTLLLALAVMVGGGLIHRRRIVNQKRRLAESTDEVDGETSERELAAAERQVHQLLRFSILAALAIGLFSIWSDALPMLQLLKRVQILPRVEMLDPAKDTATAVGDIADAPETPPQGIAESAAAVEPGGTPVPGAATTAPATPEGTTPLTLWNLLEAILAGVVAVVLVKNFPGVIEGMLQRRTTLDGGARFAISTLVRYALITVGAIVVFGLLGIGWSKVQWLAAALTFGLGFGLQEIVANFVSGLILLVERPIRVGDVVTIGNLMGRVTRIQIRATTITLWDRSEMIVPNREFITTKLVNWTLSDSKRRIQIPLQIAYGANLEQVKEILVNAANDHPAVLDEPEPHALLVAFGDDAISVELQFVVDFGQGLTTKDEVQMAIEHAFREQGIELGLPQRRVRVASESEKPAQT